MSGFADKSDSADKFSFSKGNSHDDSRGDLFETLHNDAVGKESGAAATRVSYAACSRVLPARVSEGHDRATHHAEPKTSPSWRRRRGMMPGCSQEEKSLQGIKGILLPPK